MINLNMVSPTYLIKLLLPKFRARVSKGLKSGIINLGSLAAHNPITRVATYCGSKLYLEGLSLGIDQELAADIDVMIVNVGPVKTVMRQFSKDIGTVLPDPLVKATLGQLGHEKAYTGVYQHDMLEYVQKTFLTNLPQHLYTKLMSMNMSKALKKIEVSVDEKAAKKDN